jgi:hypothetical protein
MAFVRCSRCDWEQDDFWTENYDPIKSQSTYWVELISKAIQEKDPQRMISMDRTIAMNMGVSFGIDSNGSAKVDIRDYLAKSLEILGRQIREMHWLTEDDFKKDKNKVCPRCGSPVTVD